MIRYQLEPVDNGIVVTWHLDHDEDGIHLFATATEGDKKGETTAVMTLREGGDNQRYMISCPLLRRAMCLVDKNKFTITFPD